MMNQTNDNVSKTCVVLIVIFITLHCPRVITSVGEFFVAARPNKDEVAQQLGHGVPIWLQALALISELCTMLNACLNIIIYKYMTSATVLQYCPSCLPCCIGDIGLVEIPRRTNTPVENNESTGNDINIDILGPLSMASINRPDILTEELASRHSSDHDIAMDLVSKSCTIQTPRQENECT